MNVFKELEHLLDKKTKIGLLLMVVMSVIGSGAELIGVTIIMPIIELAMDQGDLSENKYANAITMLTGADSKEGILLWMIAITIVVYIFKNMYVCYMYSRQFKFAATVKRLTATRLMRSYLTQPYSFFLNKNSSELIRAVNSDTGELFQLISNILTVFSNALTSSCIIVYLAMTNIWMTLTVSVVLGMCLLVIVFGLQKTNRKNGAISIWLTGQLIKHLQQAFEGVKEIKILNLENYFINTYDKTYKQSTDMEVKYSILNTMPKYLIELFMVSVVLVFLGGNIWMNPDYMSLIPQLAIFCVAALKLLPGVNAIYSSFNKIVFHKASIDVVYRDICLAEEYTGTESLVSEDNDKLVFNDRIVMKDITFRYDGSDVDVLHGVSLEIPKSQSVALVGPSGGGKTTTADIILSLLHPTQGCVTVDGVDVADHLYTWRRKFGYIPQSIYLIDDSIRKNVAFGVADDEIDDEAVWHSLEDAQLKEFVMSLPEGLDTKVGERGTRISGGQRQRIGIARALYRNPEILVFDEATSALDNDTEREVMAAIGGLQGTKTMIMIAHRLSTIENCDKVYRVESGKITQER